MYEKTLATIIALTALVACRGSERPAEAPLTSATSANLPPATAVYGDQESPRPTEMPAPARDLTGSAAAQSPMDQGSTETERRITTEVRKALVADPALSFLAKNVTIITQGNKVTLRGPVRDAHEKAKIDVYARHTAGVSAVDDQIEVRK